MNRRNFLSLLGLGVAGVALEQAIPLGRVWSFPSEIKIAKTINVQLVAGADFAFDPLSQVTLIEQWSAIDGRRVLLQRSLLRADGSCEVLSTDETAYRSLPFFKLGPLIPAARPVSRPSTS